MASSLAPGPEAPDPGSSWAPSHEHLAAWGVEPGYWDATGQWRDAPEAALQAVLAAMGASEPGPPRTEVPLLLVGEQGPWPELGPCTLDLEDGGTLELGPLEARPEKIPIGYHRVRSADAAGDDGREGSIVVAVSPPTCPEPAAPRSWGWSVQLYAARSTESWGIGDFADLATLARWAASNGASFLLLNPLHAPVPGPVPEPSPYFPSSRCFLNPLYISVPHVPGAQGLGELGELSEKARALNEKRLIDRASVWAYKSEALEKIFARFEAEGGDSRFDSYLVERGKVLDGYTNFCALAEIYGLPWHGWPEAYRRPDSPALADALATPEAGSRKRYHAWLQWTCERQLRDATKCGAGIVVDLAVGVDGRGADAWLWQDVFALGMRAGAPPDGFNRNGQDWGLLPWDPWRLRSVGYEPYLQMLRSVLRPAVGLRVDHVMGLFRLYWVPLGLQPSQGTYVRSPWQETVGLLRLEARRAGAFVVGEDLGTVEQHVREILAGSKVLSYKLFWFEDRPPAQWPSQALGAITTHDLPTVAGVWTNADFEAQKRLGLPLSEEMTAAMRMRLAEWTGSHDGRPLPEVIEATYGCLATAPCSLLAAVLDDAAAAEERPNMPGTTAEWPNWSISLPVPIEALEQSELAAAIARKLRGPA
jgi:4-alpha-glucanotransferase